MQVMLSDRRKLPDLSELKVTNHMNREAIQQVRKKKSQSYLSHVFQSFIAHVIVFCADDSQFLCLVCR